MLQKRLSRKRWIWAVSALGVSALGVVGAPTALAQQPPGFGPMGGTHGPATGPVGDVGAHFIQEMIPHHDDAVTMSTLALAQAEHEEVRQLAVDIIRVQNAEIAQMRAWYRDWYGEEVPPSVMATMMGSTGRFMPGTGPAGTTDATSIDGATPFDKAFIESMIPHHQMAIMMSSMMLNGVQQPELRTLLQNIITSQSEEIRQMRDWYEAWYGTPVPAGFGPGMHQGAGPGFGPGMHQGAGPGFGPGTRQGAGPGFGPGMHQGAGQSGPRGPRFGPTNGN